ncbi:Mov34/MPN/PAD-1 family protein [Geobacter sp. SVR]|uniref:Mov34/MPN/PAD-1 family protein n=1 Tax=Geobacter sp. SVR TaxID=2495594 RepID=UPI0015667382
MLSEDVLNQLKRIAQQSPKFEACGLVDDQNRVHPVKNASSTPAQNFVFDKREYFTFLRRLHEEGAKIVCVYHTHPSGSTLPSKADKEFASRFPHPSLIVTKDSHRWVK